MAELSFDIDWVDAEGINGPELSATWASLRIRAADSVITRVLDARAKTVREFVYVPLYPLAEWLATNWWFLIHEMENPAKEGDPEFHRRGDDIDELATEFGVSSLVIEHQVRNHRIARVW